MVQVKADERCNTCGDVTPLEGAPFRCVFHMTQCPGGCGDRNWCWAEGCPECHTPGSAIETEEES